MFIKNAVVTIDGITASDEVQNVTATPTVTTVSFDAISGNSQSSATLGAWNLAMTYGQDWENPDSVAHLLHENFGKEAVLTFQPTGSAGGTWTATVTLVPGAIGGAAGVATATVTLPCKAKPEWSAAPVVP